MHVNEYLRIPGEELSFWHFTNETIVKPVLSCHSKIDKTKISITNGSLMQVKSIVECSFGAFSNTFDLH